MKKILAIVMIAAIAFTGCTKSIDTPAPTPEKETFYFQVESVTIDGVALYSPITTVNN